jgi:HEAT repeat protein
MPSGNAHQELMQNLTLPVLCGQLALIALPIVCGLAWAVVQAIAEETADAGKKWNEKRQSLERPDQPPDVRTLAKNITSRRRRIRILAAECLGNVKHSAAVPVLLKAIERYDRDAIFVEAAVKSLMKLGDVRCLPTVRRLSHDRNLSLMTAARQTVAAIEPKIVLLRASAAPTVTNRSQLLRPHCHAGESEPAELLRVAVQEAS